MSDEDRRYLRFLNRRRPGLEVFVQMVEMLTNTQKRTDQILVRTKEFLLKTYKPS